VRFERSKGRAGAKGELEAPAGSGGISAGGVSARRGVAVQIGELRATGDGFSRQQEYLRGRFLAESGSPDDATESLRHFERAVAIDPDFARAHLAMAQSLVRMPGDPMASAARSCRAVLRALALHDSLARRTPTWQP